jgi:hypothetical protein
MKVNNENIDKVLNKLIASTRSPRGRFAAGNSWKQLEQRLFAKRRKRMFWLRVASSAAVVLLCVASWAAYYYVLRPEPVLPQSAPVETQSPKPVGLPDTLYFSQQPLEDITRQLSEVFHTPIRIEGDSLKNYRMTGTFSSDEGLATILDLLKGAGNFTYTQTNDTITLTSKLN